MSLIQYLGWVTPIQPGCAIRGMPFIFQPMHRTSLAPATQRRGVNYKKAHRIRSQNHEWGMNYTKYTLQGPLPKDCGEGRP